MSVPDEYRRAYQTFLRTHAKKATATDVPVAHMQYYDRVTASSPLLSMTRDDILRTLDTESTLVRWLLEQMRTYTCHTQKIVGLIFSDKVVLSDVIWVHRLIDGSGDGRETRRHDGAHPQTPPPPSSSNTHEAASSSDESETHSP